MRAASRGELALSALLLAAAFAACARDRRAESPAARSPRGEGAALVTSNILRADYAGSESCEPCHSEIYRTWSASPMHQMTRLPRGAGARAPFDGRTFRFKDDRAELFQRGDERFMRIHSKSDGEHLYRITKVIGGHHREDFAGIEVAGDRPGLPPLGDPRVELVLPVSYVYATSSYRLKGYSVMVGERPGLRAGGVWNQTCILCHNTAPYFLSMLGDLDGRVKRAYQGEVVDRLLPAQRRWRFSITDPAGARQALDEEVHFLGGEAPASQRSLQGMLRTAIDTTLQRLDTDHLLEVGIGCESCHGGAREHIASAGAARLPSYLPVSPFVRTVAAGDAPPTRAASINRTCARCHQVLFSRYPFTWEGGNRRTDPQGSHINSGEARDFLLGGCASQMSCTTCHDPHGADSAPKMAELNSIAGNRVCASCHRQYDSAESLSKHSHHDASGEGSICVNCHMPRKNMALGYGLSRYHRIGSPDDDVKVEKDRPLECALCHVDETVGELVVTMERWWGKRYDRGALEGLYGSLDAKPLLSTLARGKAHEQAVALTLLGQRRITSAAPAIARELLNRYPLVRYYAKQALDAIGSVPSDIDLDADDQRIERDGNAWLQRHGFAPLSPTTPTPKQPDQASSTVED